MENLSVASPCCKQVIGQCLQSDRFSSVYRIAHIDSPALADSLHGIAVPGPRPFPRRPRIHPSA
jgi:hypothetical protein